MAPSNDWGTPGGFADTQWNPAPTNDEWNHNGGGATASFDDGGMNDFNAPAGDYDAAAGEGGGGGGACYNCGQDGHNKADCPNPRVLKCRHCNEEGHMVRDCPTAPPREFSGECRICHQEGHMAKDCPEKPAEVCKNCQQEGHTVLECKNPRKIDRSNVEEVDAENAWDKIIQGVQEKDMDDVKEAIQQYVKACPNSTYVQLENAFRCQGIELYLIALENQSMMSTLTNMDLQGNLDKKYRVNYRFSVNPARPRERELWPKDKEENLVRLEDAGEPVSRGLTKCNNCNELGHMSKNCPQEKFEKERVVIMCFNCGEAGHRVRDCKHMYRDLKIVSSS
ncbi:hypothetical protein F5Y08DRAFT_329990 [Xylaria arbuscula]|nr:hypothetical protein F5Y08DRAFT_329990 [Xylaria arbuscula]